MENRISAKAPQQESIPAEIVFDEIDTTDAPVFARLSYEEDWEF